VPLTVVPGRPADDSQPATGLASSSLIDEIVREDARKLVAAGLQAEVDADIAAFSDERDERGRRLSAGQTAERFSARSVRSQRFSTLVRAGRRSSDPEAIEPRRPGWPARARRAG
jgi:hypothetical protein